MRHPVTGQYMPDPGGMLLMKQKRLKQDLQRQKYGSSVRSGASNVRPAELSRWCKRELKKGNEMNTISKTRMFAHSLATGFFLAGMANAALAAQPTVEKVFNLDKSPGCEYIYERLGYEWDVGTCVSGGLKMYQNRRFKNVGIKKGDILR